MFHYLASTPYSFTFCPLDIYIIPHFVAFVKRFLKIFYELRWSVLAVNLSPLDYNNIIPQGERFVKGFEEFFIRHFAQSLAAKNTPLCANSTKRGGSGRPRPDEKKRSYNDLKIRSKIFKVVFSSTEIPYLTCVEVSCQTITLIFNIFFATTSFHKELSPTRLTDNKNIPMFHRLSPFL